MVLECVAHVVSSVATVCERVTVSDGCFVSINFSSLITLHVICTNDIIVPSLSTELSIIYSVALINHEPYKYTYIYIYSFHVLRIRNITRSHLFAVGFLFLAVVSPVIWIIIIIIINKKGRQCKAERE